MKTAAQMGDLEFQSPSRRGHLLARCGAMFSQAVDLYFSPLREGDTYWHGAVTIGSWGKSINFSPLREGDTYWHVWARNDYWRVYYIADSSRLQESSSITSARS